MSQRTIAFVAVAYLGAAACATPGGGSGKPGPAGSSERSDASTAAPAPAAPICDLKLFHRWETGKVLENCMDARPCVLDQRLVDLACAGKPDPAACMKRCTTSGLEIIARAYQTQPPDLHACIDCLSTAYARYVAKCGAVCPACPAGSPEAGRCNECATAGRFFEACLGR